MEYIVIMFPMNPQTGILNVEFKENMIRQFLKNIVGMDRRQTRLAIHNLKHSLLPNYL
jgi:hypothetical protein